MLNLEIGETVYVWPGRSTPYKATVTWLGKKHFCLDNKLDKWRLVDGRPVGDDGWNSSHIERVSDGSTARYDAAKHEARCKRLVSQIRSTAEKISWECRDTDGLEAALEALRRVKT